MKSIYSKMMFMAILVFSSFFAQAQYTAMDFNKMDCNGTDMRHLFADLDSGKAVLLHFFMPNCGSCPPPARTLQSMANNINAMQPGLVKGYAFPFNNTTTCSYASTWVSSNGLSSFYTPMDSGAAAVAHYGGFGMPTVVVLGGMDHRVMYASQSFSTADTSAIRDSIMTLMMSTTGLNELPKSVSLFNVFPNPATNNITVDMALTEAANVSIVVTDMAGKQIAIVMNSQSSRGRITKQFDTQHLSNGLYIVRANVNGKMISQKLTVTH
jgi:thiol-disulfide isomerase/thioredoxin